MLMWKLSSRRFVVEETLAFNGDKELMFALRDVGLVFIEKKLQKKVFVAKIQAKTRK
jgi:hypothetical protein